MIPLLLAFIGSLCGGVFFNVRKGRLVWTGLAGAAGWAVYMVLINRGMHPVMCIFTGAIAVGLYSETAARVFKSPSTIYSIPGIFPLVPGITAYESIQLLMENQLQAAAGKGVETLAGAGAIACGILLATAFFRMASRSRTKNA